MMIWFIGLEKTRSTYLCRDACTRMQPRLRGVQRTYPLTHTHQLTCLSMETTVRCSSHFQDTFSNCTCRTPSLFSCNSACFHSHSSSWETNEKHLVQRDNTNMVHAARRTTGRFFHGSLQTWLEAQDKKTLSQIRHKRHVSTREKSETQNSTEARNRKPEARRKMQGDKRTTSPDCVSISVVG